MSPARELVVRPIAEQPGAGRTGRHVEHDPASLDYTVEEKLSKRVKPKPVLWTRYGPVLDQRDLGGCTGFAATGWLQSAPYAVSALQAAAYTNPFAINLYGLATKRDRIAGSYPPADTGSTGLAVCKAMRDLGLIGEYRHALTTTGLLRALVVAPVIVGVPWKTGMDDPAADGTVEVQGDTRGGHEFLIRGVEPDEAGGKLDSTAWLYGDNSWGLGWGRRGSFRFRVAGWDILRSEQGDVQQPLAA